MKRLIAICSVAVLLSGCLDVKQYDPQTVKNVQASKDFNLKLREKLAAILGGSKPPTKAQINGIVEFTVAEDIRLDTWLIMEEAKHKEEAAFEETTTDE